MKSSIKITQFKKLLRDREEGFSLIELVVVVSVLAVLAAIALPTFSCITRKAKATSALAAMKQIQTECAVKEEEEESAATFVSSNLQGYEIESDGSNSCNGASGTGLIRAIPNDSVQLPTFILATNSNELTYSFRGQTGTNFTDCLDLVCERAEIESGIEPLPLPDPEPITGCPPNCMEDEQGNCTICMECLAYGPGLCGMPPCGDQIWEGTDYCPEPEPEPEPEQGTQVRFRNIYGGSGTPDDDWLGGYDGLPSGCRMLRPGKTVWEPCPSGCVRTPGGNGEGTCPPGSI